MLADAADATDFTIAPPTLVRTDLATTTGFTPASSTLVLTDLAAATGFTPAFATLVLADPAATTFFTVMSSSLVLAKLRGLAGSYGSLEHWRSLAFSKPLLRAANFVDPIFICKLLRPFHLACCNSQLFATIVALVQRHMPGLVYLARFMRLSVRVELAVALL